MNAISPFRLLGPPRAEQDCLDPTTRTEGPFRYFPPDHERSTVPEFRTDRSARRNNARHQGDAASRSESWRRRSEKWRSLMVAAQRGESRAYEQLLRELDAWLRRYYARRLPAAAAEDARQDALFAVHLKRHTYAPSRPFGPWVAAIARYKWIDHVRAASRFVALSLHDEIPTEDPGEAAISAVAMDDLLKRLKPAQARVIRLVKLQGVSIEGASDATGQSASLVKVNIHRGLKKLAAIAAGEPLIDRTA
jgi:RNA polymerase sigma factor (sigma-70 family)